MKLAAHPRKPRFAKRLGGTQRIWLTLILLAAFASPASAQTPRDQVYAMGTGSNNIYVVNANGSTTSVYTNYGATDSAAAAMRASDGLIFFITNVANGAVYTWNPATPGTAPIKLGNTGSAIPYIPRLAFNTSDVLYGVDTNTTALYTINQSTGVATKIATLSGVPTNLGGDIAFAPDGTLYMVADVTLYKVSLTGTVTSLGAISGMGTNSGVGIAFDSSGNLLVADDQTPAQVYSVNISTRVATALGSKTSVSEGDLASAPRVQITGTVFEDINYGGGAGRSLSASAGVARPNARVELYDASGNFVTSTTTNASGVYTLSGAAGQTYTVRVVNSTVTSSRSGATSSLTPVQTFRTSGGAADTERVGGEDPAKIDAGNGSTSLAALTTSTTVPQSISSVALGTTAVSGVDFGFNFDTIVNVRDSGQGSLRQFILNSNALSNTGLAQVGQTSGVEASIFMIPSGTDVPGLRPGLASQLTGGVAQIVLASALPAISDAKTSIDGTIQSADIGDNNPGTLGAGGTVGVDNIALPTVTRPDVQISAAQGAIGIGLDLAAANATVRGLAIYGFGTAANSNGSANIQIETAGTGALIEKNILGTSATSFADPGATTRSKGDNIRSVAASSGTIQNNLIGYAQGKGIAIESGSNGWTIQKNEVRGNAINNVNLGGIHVESSSAATVQYNLFIANNGVGVDTNLSTGSNTILDNTVSGNGSGTGTDMGVRISGTGNTVDRNIITGNFGAGVTVTSSATTVITKNSIFNNGSSTGEIGIDLLSSSDNISLGTSPFVTLNDSGDPDTGGNGLLNYPVLQSATFTNGTLTVSGYARPGSAIELFISAPDASGFGEGQTYLTTLTEGSASDLDATTGTYGPAAINGVAQGTDTTNKFKFSIPAPAGVTAGTVLTATATLSGATSEFSGNVTVSVLGSISGTVYLDTNHNGNIDSGEDWSSGTPVFLNLVSGSTVVQTLTVAAGTGSFTFSNVGAGTYSLVLTTSATATAATAPTAFGFVYPTAGSLAINISNGSVSNVNFGLFKGVTVSGTVFQDAGTGSGTANNGIKDGTEAGIPNVILTASNGSGTVYDTATTDASGAYTLRIPSTATTVVIAETNPQSFISTGASAAGGAYSLAADTITFTNSGASRTNYNFGDVPDSSFQADASQQAQPGSVVFYSHSFSADTAGSVTFTPAATEFPANLPFGHTLYAKIVSGTTNCSPNFDSSATVVTAAITVPTAGARICLYEKVSVPSGAPQNASDVTKLNASFAFANSAIVRTYSLTDTTTVGVPNDSGLTLLKSVDLAQATPGTTITYTLTFTNDSAGQLSNVVIYDATPAYTTFVSATCPVTLPNTLSACTITSPAASATGSIKWTFAGSLAPSQSGSVTFKVKIQ